MRRLFLFAPMPGGADTPASFTARQAGSSAGGFSIRRSRSIVLAVFLSAASFALAAAAAPRAPNDAGSGMDAGNDPAAALVLLSSGRYAGNLTPPGDDRDWYRLPSGAATGVCGAARAQGVVTGQAVLTGLETRDPSIARSLSPSATTRLFLAVPEATSILLGIEGTTATTALSTFDGGSRGDEPRGGAYFFDVAAYTVAQLDPEGDGEGVDAGATPAAAKPQPGPCFAGRLDARDAGDVYSFAVTSGSTLDVSFATPPTGDLRLRILGSNGATLLELASGDARSLSVTEDATWYAEVVRTASSAAPTTASARDGRLDLPLAASTADGDGAVGYLVAVSDGTADDPDTTSCRPMCTS